jgi:uncharacterized protein with FMN-binding domain
MPDKSSTKKIQAGLALFVIAAIIIVGSIMSRPKSSSSMDSNTTAAATKTSNTSKPTNTASTNKALTGTYKAVGSYDSPGGVEHIDVSLTLSNSVVTAADVVSKANDPTASSYQNYFISGYKSYVIGKKVTDIKLSNVSGSSLTSQGFNEALKSIISQAQQA